VRVDGELRPGNGKQLAGVFGRNVVRQDRLVDGVLVEKRLGDHGDLVNQQVGARCGLLDVRAVAGVAGKDDRVPRVGDLVPAGGHDELSMINVEGRHGDTSLAEDEAGTDVMGFDLDARYRIHFVRETDSPIFGEGIPQIGHHLFGSRRAENHERRLTAAERGLDPTAHPKVGQPVDVIRVEVGQKMGVDAAQRNLLLPKTNRRTPPEVEDEPQPWHFHQRAISEAVHRRDRASGAEQRDRARLQKSLA
jgi:hypothetical protein